MQLQLRYFDIEDLTHQQLKELSQTGIPKRSTPKEIIVVEFKAWHIVEEFAGLEKVQQDEMVEYFGSDQETEAIAFASSVNATRIYKTISLEM